MAGQGLNLGLLDANILANVVCKSLEEGARVGEVSRLFEYELLSKKNNYLMQAGMEALKLSYGFKAEPLSFARNLAVDLINNTPLKKLAMDFAGGEFYEETRRIYKQSS
jgi:2-octaprenylphenol hydroxylase